MKTRIILKQGRYYPQFKTFFSWLNYVGDFCSVRDDWEIISFHTKDEAINFLSEGKPEENYFVVWESE